MSLIMKSVNTSPFYKMSAPTLAILGCGRIAHLLEDDPLRMKPCTHFGGAIAAGFRISGGVDPQAERRESFQNRSGAPVWATFKELLSNHIPDAVTIAATTNVHFDLATEAIDAGVAVIILEKPVCATLEQAHRLQKEAAKNESILLINHERRYDNRYRTAHQIINSGGIGTLRTINARILRGPIKKKSRIEDGGGPLLHDGTHLIDMIHYLAGPVRELRGRFDRDDRDEGFEDRALAWMKLECGADVFLEAGGSRNFFSFEMEFSGTDGVLKIGNGFEELYQPQESKYYKGFKDAATAVFPEYTRNSYFTDLYQEARALLEDDNAPVTSSLKDGVAALEVIHGIYLSSYNHSAVVEFPLDTPVDLSKIFNLS